MSQVYMGDLERLPDSIVTIGHMADGEFFTVVDDATGNKSKDVYQIVETEHCHGISRVHPDDEVLVYNLSRAYTYTFQKPQHVKPLGVCKLVELTRSGVEGSE